MTDNVSTLPKPFVFVLMPFAAEFDDIYKFGIKGAADDVGAYAERIDEQIFSEGMLDRIFNQISKADVVVADMTGRNPNVFYEVGYAHALGKLVILLTQRADDIPFDLQHRQHTVYGGRIETLRVELAAKLRWALAQRNAGATTMAGRYSIRIVGEPIPEVGVSEHPPLLKGYIGDEPFPVTLHVRNESTTTSDEITHVYLFASSDSDLIPRQGGGSFQTLHSRASLEVFQPIGTPTLTVESFAASDADAADGLTQQYRLPLSFGPMPPGAVDSGHFFLGLAAGKKRGEAFLRLRLHTTLRYYDFAWRFRIVLTDDIAEARCAFDNWGSPSTSTDKKGGSSAASAGRRKRPTTR